MSEQFLVTAELAERCKISSTTLERDRMQKQGCPYFKLGGAVRYRLSDILAYEAARREAVGENPCQPYIDIHDAVVKDNDRLYALLGRCETEMRYAGWNKFEADNTARNGVYEQVKRTLFPTIESEKNT